MPLLCRIFKQLWNLAFCALCPEVVTSHGQGILLKIILHNGLLPDGLKSHWSEVTSLDSDRALRTSRP